MVIYFVKSFRQIYWAQICCVATFDKILHDTTSAVYGMTTAQAFFEPKLISSLLECIYNMRDTLIKHQYLYYMMQHTVTLRVGMSEKRWHFFQNMRTM